MILFNNKTNKDAVVIGCDIKKNNPIMLSRNDRYTNMLIVGAAGCGKTTRTIIPMIKQDIENKYDPMGITVLEPNGDLTARAYELVLHHNKLIEDAQKAGTYTKEKYGEHKTVVWFNPTLEDCPYFNPLEGHTDDVINSITEAFLRINVDSPQFFKDMMSTLFHNAIKTVKVLYENDATLLDLHTVICDRNEGWISYVSKLNQMKVTTNGEPLHPVEVSRNKDIVNWFINDYYSDKTKTFEYMDGVRKQLTKLIECDDLRNALCPPRKGTPNHEELLKFQKACSEKGIPYKLNLNDSLKNGHIVLINTARSSYRELGFLLGHIMIQSVEAAITRRAIHDRIRVPNMLYVDDFPAYANWNIIELLRISESLHIATHLSTQSLAQLGMGLGETAKDFISIVNCHTKNKIIYPNLSYADIKHFEAEFNIKANDIIVGLNHGQIMYKTQKDIGIANLT